jgi:hypothetical protein
MYPFCAPIWSGNHMNLCLGVPEPLTHAGLRRAADGTRTHDLLHGKERVSAGSSRPGALEQAASVLTNQDNPYARDTASCTPCVPREEI